MPTPTPSARRIRANIAPVRMMRLALPGAAPPTSPTLLTRLWPTDKPIYKRPAAIGGAVLLVAGIVGYLYFAEDEEEERVLPAVMTE